MRNRDKRLAALELLDAGERATRHGWVLDAQATAAVQNSVERVAGEGLAELANRETRAELSALHSRPVRWAARLSPHGRDALLYARAAPLTVPAPNQPAPGEQHVHLRPAQMDAVRRFVALASDLATPPADGLAERVRAADFSRTDNRWQLCLTPQQIASVAYGLYLYRLTCSEAEANRFARDYNVIYRQHPDTGVPTALSLPSPPGPARVPDVRTVQISSRRESHRETGEDTGETADLPGRLDD
ncbi:DUF6417 family protein [Streptomyces sp. NPDC091280]|uniref:DUF6417 family protein n=1 Tax=Streptomyces sp. NPDC091280 TaxID=3365984 RepID=UPI003830F363